MHIAVIIDQERLLHEQAMLDRVLAGLAEEGVRITRVTPDTGPTFHAAEVDQGAGDVDRLEVPMVVSPWMRRARAHQLAKAMESSVPDVLYAMGEDAWKVALDLANVIDRPVMIDLWSAEQVKRAPHRRSATAVSGYVVPTEPIAEALRGCVDPQLVTVVPWGVASPEYRHEVLADVDKAVALAIIGSGRDIAAYRAMITGLSLLTKEFGQIQACLELRGPHEHDIWRHARRLGLLGHISGITDAALHRQLLTACDILIVPERYGQVRSLVIEAMAFGMPVVASDDPFLDLLVPDETAIIIPDSDPDGWARQLRRVLTEPQLASRLGATAQARVAQNHRCEQQAAGLKAAFDRVLNGPAHAFAQANT